MINDLKANVKDITNFKEVEKYLIKLLKVKLLTDQDLSTDWGMPFILFQIQEQPF